MIQKEVIREILGIGLQASHNPNLRVGKRDCCKRQENRSDTCMEMVTWFIAIIQNVKAEASITI